MTGQQLKNSILQMAVQGKLVPQDPNDEPASELLKRIRAEKERLIKDGKIKREKNPSVIFKGPDNLPYEKVGKNAPVCIADEVPFEIPDSWEWVRLGSICQLSDGEKLQNQSYHNLDARYMRGKAEPTIIKSGKFVSKGTNLILVDGENSGEVFIAPEDGYMGSTFKVLWITSQLYILYVLKFIELYKEALRNTKIGAAIPHLNKKLFFDLLIPLPPLAEQRRIVSAIESVESSIHDYSIKEEALRALNKAFPEALKKSILQEAVQGKLVPQDPSDEPASVLLERIRTEKERLVKEGKIKRDKHESVIFRRGNSHYEKLDGREHCIDDEIPFEIPNGWEWVKLGTICQLNDGEKLQNQSYHNLDARYMRGKTEPTILKCGKFVSKGTNLILLDGENSGEVFTAPENGYMGSTFKVLWITTQVYVPYVLAFIKLYKETLKHTKRGAAIPHLDKKLFFNLLTPIPPLNEQKRIVNAIDRAFSMVNKLENN